MQPLVDNNARTGLNPATVSFLLQGAPSITVTYGCEWYSSALTYLGDITAYMTDGSTVTSDFDAAIHRSCSLIFDAACPMNPASDFVKPYMVLTNTDTGDAARFNLGVYTLQTPTYDNSNALPLRTYAGYDLLQVLNQPMADAYELPAGSDPAAAATALILGLLPNAVVDADVGQVTGQVYTWPFTDGGDNTVLAVVNDLLLLAGFDTLWVDWDGAFQMHAYVDPSTQSPEWTFDLGSATNIIAEARTSTQDFYSVPNWWRFVIQNLTASPSEGSTQFTYTDNNLANSTSYPNRGYLKRKVVFVDAVSYGALLAQGVKTIVSDLNPAETFTMSSSPFPLAWHGDRISYVDSNLGNVPPTYSQQRYVQAVGWTLPLDGQSDMTWTWRTLASGINPV